MEGDGRLLFSVVIATGHDPGMAGAMIAGIAEVHGLVCLSYTRHSLPFGVAVMSPDEVAAGEDDHS